MQRYTRQLLNLRTFLLPSQHNHLTCAAMPTLVHHTATFATTYDVQPTASSDTQATTSSHPQQGIGIVHILKSVLQSAEAPLTSDQVWEHAAREGCRSKTHTKRILALMKKSGQVGTRLVDRRKRRYGYYLKPRGEAQLEKQQQRQEAGQGM